MKDRSGFSTSLSICAILEDITADMKAQEAVVGRHVSAQKSSRRDRRRPAGHNAEKKSYDSGARLQSVAQSESSLIQMHKTEE